MKRYTYIIIAAVLMACSSCTSFLNVEQLGKNTIDGFFASIDGMKSAGIGLHRALLEFYDDEYLRMGDVQGDKVEALRINADEATLLIYDFESIAAHNAGHPYYVWNKGYDVITNANQIIAHAPALLERYPKQAETVNKNVAYAYFVRALMIFNLCNVYAMPYDYTDDASHLGVVPVDYVPGFDSVLDRKSIKKCYELVLSDIAKALEIFGGDDVESVYYANGLACEALYARVYLYMKDYDKAAEYAKIVMDKVALTSRDKYVDMFRRAQSNPGEAIFRLNTYDAGSSMRSTCNPIMNQDIRPDAQFVNTFDSNDIRKELFTYTGEKEDGDAYVGLTYRAICKMLAFKTDEAKEENRRCDYFVFRVSEMYLTYAEALCLGPNKDLTKAAEAVKAIRARALGVNASDITLSYSSADELDAIVAEERAKELCFEGHRFFDLKRRHENVVRSSSTTSNMKLLEYPDYRYALPISQTEMQANENMVQNDGYEGRKQIGGKNDES